MRVPLDAHEVLDLHFAEPADPAEVVPRQVHQHQVLRPLLLVGQQFGGEGGVFLFAPPPAAGPGDGPGLHPPPPGAGHHLRRSPGDREGAEIQVVHVGGGVHHPQRPVEVEGVDGQLRREPLRGDHLDHIPGGQVVLAPPDDVQVLVPRGVRRHRGQGRRLPVGLRRRAREGAGEVGDHPGDPRRRFVVRRIRLLRRADPGVGDHLDHIAGVVERQHRVREQEHRVREAQRVGDGLRQPLEPADGVVGQVADQAAVERRESVPRRRDEVGEFLPERLQRVGALEGLGPAVVVPAAGHPVAPAREAQQRLPAEEGVARHALAAFHRLHQERRPGVPAGARPADAQEGRDRGVQIRQDLPAHRDQVRLPGEGPELGARRGMQPGPGGGRRGSLSGGRGGSAARAGGARLASRWERSSGRSPTCGGNSPGRTRRSSTPGPGGRRSPAPSAG